MVLGVLSGVRQLREFQGWGIKRSMGYGGVGWETLELVSW